MALGQDRAPLCSVISNYYLLGGSHSLLDEWSGLLHLTKPREKDFVSDRAAPFRFGLANAKREVRAEAPPPSDAADF